jgi:hypothetical protein
VPPSQPMSRRCERGRARSLLNTLPRSTGQASGRFARLHPTGGKPLLRMTFLRSGMMRDAS